MPPYNNNRKELLVNLVFSDGADIHIRVFPEMKIVDVFGGFVGISDELAAEFQELSK